MVKESRFGELLTQWRTLLGSALGVALGTALYPLYVMPLLGLQFEHLLGWSRVENASLLTAMSAGNLIGMLITGRIVDAFGPRWPAVIATIALGALLALTPFAPISVNMWRIGAFFFSLLGNPTGPVAYSRAICDNFSRARGLALGLTFGAIGLAGAIMPSIFIALMARFGVAGGLQIVGFAYILMLAPVIAILLPRKGLHTIAADASAAAMPETTVTIIPLVSWVRLTTGFVLLTAAGFGAAASIPALAHDTGVGSPVLMLAALSLTIALARPLSGFLIDLMSAQLVAAALCIFTAIGLLTIAVAPHLLLLGAVLIGLALGAEVDILAFMVSRYAARDRESRIFSQIYFLIVAAIAISPLAFAYMRGLAGNYRLVLFVAAAILLLAGILIGGLPSYTRGKKAGRNFA